MRYTVEIVLRERDYAVTEEVHHHGNPPSSWTELDVEGVLKSMLEAIDRVKNPGDEPRPVRLRGFSWIVEPTDGGVVIAMEIPSGAAVAGPFDIAQPRLDGMITRVLDAARDAEDRRALSLGRLRVDPQKRQTGYEIARPARLDLSGFADVLASSRPASPLPAHWIRSKSMCGRDHEITVPCARARRR